MNCHYCGTQLKDGALFCFYCGTKQHPPQPEPEPPVPEVPIRISAPEPELKPEPRPRMAPVAAPARPRSPRLRLPTTRGLAKMIFLGILTLGIYPTVIWSRMATEINITASRYDGERTVPYFAMLLLTPLTLGIYCLVWHHHFCRRVGAELKRRRLDFTFDTSDFWLWNILGLLILVGPFIYTFKLMRAMNQLNEDYNLCG